MCASPRSSPFVSRDGLPAIVAPILISQTIGKEQSERSGRAGEEGYFEALSEHKIEVDESLIINCSSDMISNFTLINNLLKKRKKVDGLFSSAENLAILSYQICSELAINIPKDLKIVSFSNMPMASYLNPSLSTITQPAFEMGKEAASLLFLAIEKPRNNYKDVFTEMKSNLFIRNSTKRIFK